MNQRLKLFDLMKHPYKKIKPMKKLFILTFLGLHALFFAQYKVTGQVANQLDGKSLQGVTLTIKNSQVLAVTDSDGNFSFSTSDSEVEIKFHKKGFSLQKVNVPLPLQQPLRILMSESVVDIEEITLSTGYQKIPKERSTGSFSSVSKDQIDKQVGTGILERIVNTANAVTFERGTSGEPQLMIRGISTINGPKSPLIVVDDFPYEGAISNINPNMVESVTVLKDAAAASIWGARAANGVIVITTKKSKMNSGIQAEFSASTTISGKPSLGSIKTISSADFIEVEKELFNRGFYDSEINSPSHPVLSPVVDLLNQEKKGLLSSEEVQRRINQLKTVDSKEQFRNYVYRPAENRQYFLNINGGSKEMSWLSSLGYDDNTGNLGETYKRLNARLQNTWKAVERLTVVLGAHYTDSETMSGGIGYGNIDMKNGNAVPYLQLADQYGNALAVSKTYDQRYKGSLSQYQLLDWNYYPLNDWKHDWTEGRLQEIILNTGITYKVMKGLDAEIKYQYQRQNVDDQTIHGKQSYYARNYVNSFAQIEEDNSVKFVVPKGDIRDYYSSITGVNNLRGQLNYNNTWDKHLVTAIAGAEVRQSKIESKSNRYYGVDENNLNTGAVDYVNPYPMLVTGWSEYIQKSESIGGRNTRFVSLFANAAYTFDHKYTLSGSVRRDASNLFGLKTNDQWNPFWSVGAGWELSKEKFFSLEFLPYLKIRASYGFNGNIDPAMVAVSTIAYDGDNSVYTGTPTARFDNYYNPKLRWETSGMLNIGFDFSGQNNRISGSVDFFRKRGKDLFGPQMLDYTTGIGYMLTNIAKTEGRGFDVNINSQIINSQLKWKSILNFSTFKDKVVNYYLSDPMASQFIGNGSTVPISGILGLPVYSIFAYKWGGLDPETGDPMGYLNGERSKNYSAITGTGTSVEDLEYYGSAIPTIYGSLINTFSYKSLSLDFAVSYKLGYWFRRSSINYSNLFDSWIGHSDYANRWQKPGDENLTDVPSNTYTSNYSRDAFYNGSSVLVEKGDHIRLQYITLNYHFNTQKNINNSKLFQDLNLFLNVSNLGILWRANKKGIDPDYNIGRNTLRSPASFTIGLRTKF